MALLVRILQGESGEFRIGTRHDLVVLSVGVAAVCARRAASCSLPERKWQQAWLAWLPRPQDEPSASARLCRDELHSTCEKVEVSQIAGLLTDNFALKKMYVATEAAQIPKSSERQKETQRSNTVRHATWLRAQCERVRFSGEASRAQALQVLALAMLVCGHASGSVLFILNIGPVTCDRLSCPVLRSRCRSGLGLLYSFSQPVTKSMPPAVTPSREDWRFFLSGIVNPSSGQDLAVINGWDLTCDKASSMQILHDM